MQRSIRLRLNDIIRAIDGTEGTIEGVRFETFQFEYHMPRTVERSIEIISEASRRIPLEMKAEYPDIPWKQIAGLRDKVIHDYFGVDLEIVWAVVERDLPTLRVAVQHLLDLP